MSKSPCHDESCDVLVMSYVKREIRLRQDTFRTYKKEVPGDLLLIDQLLDAPVVSYDVHFAETLALIRGRILNTNISPVGVFGPKVTPVNDQLIPAAEIVLVKGTPYDFLGPQEILSKINELHDRYDINYVLDPSNHKHLRKAAALHNSVSGQKLELWANMPGLQFYTSNMLDNVKGKGRFVYKKHAAVCLETQGFLDSMNHPNFPSQVVKPGETYLHVMLHRFTAS